MTASQQSGLAPKKEEKPAWQGEGRQDQTEGECGKAHQGLSGNRSPFLRLDQRRRGERWEQRLEGSRVRPGEAPTPGEEFRPQDKGGLTDR